jgi:Holliday junction resolvase RusA-like endonuclease
MGNIYISFKTNLKKALKKMTNQKTKYKNLKKKMRHYTSMEQMSFLLSVAEGHKRSNNGSQLSRELTVRQFCSIKHYKPMLINS